MKAGQLSTKVKEQKGGLKILPWLFLAKLRSVGLLEFFVFLPLDGHI